MEININQFTDKIKTLFLSEKAMEFVARGTRNSLHSWYAELPDDWFDNPEPFPDGTPRHAGARSFMAPLRTAWEYSIRDAGFNITFDEKRQVEGYRVLVYSGNTSRAARDEANKMAQFMRENFPGAEVYVEFDPPIRSCQYGDYRTREEAEAVMYKLKATKKFKEISVKKGIINLPF